MQTRLRWNASLLAVALVAAQLLLTGCHVTNHKSGNSDNVDIGTPFGNMQVKTNDNVNTAGLGITPYPGAVLEKKEGNDDSAADFNLNFGKFHVGVKAVSYLTPDSQAKVLAFYRNDLKKYGDIIECHGSATIGTPTRTSQGLTCDDKDHGNHVSVGTDEDKSLELRTGSKEHQHIVAVEPKGDSTKIGLVALDLPHGVSDDSNSAE